MTRKQRAISGYHAHVYYDVNSKAVAARLRRRIAARFDTDAFRRVSLPLD